MTTAQIVGVAALIVVALIAAVSLKLSDGRKHKEENRKKGIEAYRSARTSWDQAQVEEITLPVRREKLTEVRRGLIEIKLLVGSDVETREFSDLVNLLDGDLLGPGSEARFQQAQALWPQVEAQIQDTLAP